MGYTPRPATLTVTHKGVRWMRQLSELDASFLYLESETTPMHIGGVYLFDASGLSDPLAFSTFVSYLRSRLHVVPLFRQKLKEIPLRLGRPYWIDDPGFSIERHLAYVNLGEHGKQASLMSLASKIMEEPLKRDRPLWHITLDRKSTRLNSSHVRISYAVFC